MGRCGGSAQEEKQNGRERKHTQGPVSSVSVMTEENLGMELATVLEALGVFVMTLCLPVCK